MDFLIATHSPDIISDRWDLTVELKGPALRGSSNLQIKNSSNKSRPSATKHMINGMYVAGMI